MAAKLTQPIYGIKRTAASLETLENEMIVSKIAINISIISAKASEGEWHLKNKKDQQKFNRSWMINISSGFFFAS